jgi:riboflavin kinase/FMN adenylyltransferase
MCFGQFSIFISQLLLHASMNVYKNTEELPVFKNAVITIGTFDGVHTGHAQILDQLVKEAEKINGTPVLITFYPHPKQVVQGMEKPIYILNEPEEKYELLAAKGIHNIVVVPFDKSFSELSATDYIEKFLIEKFQPKIIITGYDHRFGNNREGDYELLADKTKAHHCKVIEIPKHVLQDVAVSSTKIREALLAGNVEKAEKYLGYQYFFTGKVVEGNKLGRTIGYPTANLQIEHDDKLIPANGVYAVDVQFVDRKLKGMMNIGVRPTVDGKKRVIEVNIFDFNEDIYGQNLKITIKKKLREEVKFSGLDDLEVTD